MVNMNTSIEPSVEPKKPKEPSLRDQINNSKTVEELNRAVSLGNTYAHASEKTRRRWKEAAKAKLKELEKAK